MLELIRARPLQHGVNMNTSLTTFDGYPRDDIDVAQSVPHSVVLCGSIVHFSIVRTTRARIIRLRNDYKSLMSRIEAGLHAHHAEARNHPAQQSGSASSQAPTAAAGSLEAPFAKVNSVVAGSPAEEAGLRAGDKIRRFGDVDWINHEKLSKVAETVQRNEGVSQSAVTLDENFFADIARWWGTEEHYCQNPAKPASFVKYRGIAFAVNTTERLGWPWLVGVSSSPIMMLMMQFWSQSLMHSEVGVGST